MTTRSANWEKWQSNAVAERSGPLAILILCCPMYILTTFLVSTKFATWSSSSTTRTLLLHSSAWRETLLDRKGRQGRWSFCTLLCIYLKEAGQLGFLGSWPARRLGRAYGLAGGAAGHGGGFLAGA